MTSIKYSINYTAVIEDLEKKIVIRDRFSTWNLCGTGENPETIDEAIDKMDLDPLIDSGYKIIRE